MTDTTRDAFEEWAEDYCLTDGFTKQDCFFAWQAATLAAQSKHQPLSDEALLLEFGKLYPQDVVILEIAKHNNDYALESIGARHHWAAFKYGARAIEAAHGITATPHEANK